MIGTSVYERDIIRPAPAGSNRLPRTGPFCAAAHAGWLAAACGRKRLLLRYYYVARGVRYTPPDSR